jgi:iron complex outermembrane recepter protein
VRSDVRCNRRLRATAAKDVLHGLWAAPLALLMASSVVSAQENSNQTGSSSTTLPEIHVIATTPVAPPRTPARAPTAAAAPTPARTPARTTAAHAAAPTPAVAAALETAAKAVPGAVELDKVPSNVVTVGAPAFDGTKAPDLLQSMDRALPGVSLSSQTGNEFQLDVNYRGYVAGPVIGTPEGLAVYQNGVRINEVFGDVVNWDLIPQKAINQLTLVPSNPVYGLNATGGALAFEMKNGYTYHAVEGEIIGGSYGRAGATVQAGGEVGNLSGYITADAIDDAGWRQDTPSSLRRVYADLGARGDQTEFHVNFTGADNNFSANPATPVQMLAQNWASTYTLPQTTQNQLAFLTASATWKPSDTWTYQAIAYFRNFTQNHVDGNPTNAQNSGCPDPTALCFPNLDGTVANLVTTRGQTVPANGALATSFLGEIDRTWTTTNSFGGSVQASSAEKVFGHGNNFTIGLSVDRGLVHSPKALNLAPSTLTSSRSCKERGFSSTSLRATSHRWVWALRRSIPASTRPTRSTSPRVYRSRPAAATTSRKST